MSNVVPTRRAARDMAVQIVGRLGNALLGVVAVVLLTRELGVAGFGQWSTILAVCGIAGYVGDLGLEAAAVRRAAAEGPATHGEILRTLLILRLLFAVPATVASVMAVLLLSRSTAMSTAGVVVALLTPVAAVSTLRAVFQLRVRNDVPMAVMTVNSVFWTGAVIVLAATRSVTLLAVAIALAVVNTATTALQAALALRTQRLRTGAFRRWAPELMRVGLVVGIGQLLTFAYVRVDQVLVLHYTDERQAGLYGAAYQLLDRAQLLPMAVLTTLLPLLASAYTTDRGRLAHTVALGVDVLALVSFPVFAFALVAARPLLVTLFGQEFGDAAPALPVLMAAFVLTAFGYLLGNLALVAGTQRRLVVIATVALVVNVGLNVLLLPRYGFIAAAWVTLVTEVVVCTCALPSTFGRLGLRPPLGRVARLLVASGLMAASIAGLQILGLHIGWLLLAAPVVYGAATLALGGVDIAELRRFAGRQS
jgi:O-antigen/teichoic acid export membrane protein